MLMTCLFIVVLLLMAGMALDIGRAWVAREQLQTAVDAAALSGSYQATKMVEVTVIPGWCNTCCGKESCWCCCQHGNPTRREGTEKFIIGQRGWEHHSCDIGYWLENRWIEFNEAKIKDTAYNMLAWNWPDLLDTKFEESKKQVETYEEGSPYYPSTVVRAEGKVYPALLPLIGIKEIPIKRFSQSAVFFEEVINGWNLGKNPPPEPVWE